MVLRGEMRGLVFLVGFVVSASLAVGVVSTAAPGLAGDPVIAAAGDIACPTNTATATTCRHRYTSDILVSGGFDAVLPLGDNQYLSGALSDFQAYYDPTWGRVKSITHPTPGNNDYTTPGASGYFGYFGAAAGDPQMGYYSYDLGSWHIIALNSNCSNIGGCDTGSPQEQWLRADLAPRSTACTLAYWHHPRFSSGAGHGSDPRTQALWQALYDFHADVVLNGHEHNYERFAPQAPTGAADPTNGIREFVVGTGGRNLYPFGTPIANSVVRNSETFGVLKLALHAASYEWSFLPEAGSSFTDSGSSACTDPHDFGLNATPLSRTVTPGTATSYAVTVSPSGGFSGTVSLSVSGLPSGASASFSPNPVVVSTPTSSSLSLTTSATTTPGSYNLTITGASGAISHSRAVTLVVGGQQRIVFQHESAATGNDEIYSMNADGSDVVNLTNNLSEDLYPVLSPDGTKIAFTTNRDGNYNIYLMNADGSNPTQFTAHAAIDEYPAWSPNSQQLAWVSNRDGDLEIFKINVNRTGLVQLTNNTAVDRRPAWSADGAKIVFDSDRDGDYDLYTMSATGTNVTNLTNNTTSDAYATWSPDNTKITFGSTRDGDYEIFTMPATGGAAAQLTTNPSTDRFPTWSPDGTMIAFDSNRDGDYEIYKMSGGGGVATQLTINSPDGDLHASWGG